MCGGRRRRRQEEEEEEQKEQEQKNTPCAVWTGQRGAAGGVSPGVFVRSIAAQASRLVVVTVPGQDGAVLGGRARQRVRALPTPWGLSALPFELLR